MPKVMPVAIRDETGAFIRQMAQGNEALAQLYARLLAQYHERRESEAFRREMFDKGVQEKRDYWDYTQGTQDESDKPHPFGSRGAQPNPVSPPTAPAAPTTTAPAAARPMPMMPGATPIPGQDSFTPGGGTSTQPAPSPASTTGGVPATPGYDSFAQASPLVEEFSSQQRIGAPPPPDARLPRGARSVAPPPGQLPRGTGMDARPRRSRKPPTQAEFLPIGEEWLDKMSAAEKKYGVPQGSLLALYGFENAGGRVLGKNSRSSAAGLFQFTEQLMKDYKLDPSLRNNPDVMIDLAARNMSRNARVLERDYKVKLEPNSETLPFFTLMHQLGIGDGPRVVAMLLKNPDAPMVKVMANVPGRDNATTLVNNGIPSNYTVGQVFGQHSGVVRPWYDNGLKLLGNRTQQPGGAADTKVAQPQAPAAPTTQSAQPVTTPTTGGQPPRPPANVGVSMSGVNPRLVAAVNGGAQYLPEGYTIRATSGHRPHGPRDSHHYRGNAGDWKIYTPDGKPIENKGDDTTGMYTRLARGVKTWVQENDPQLLTRIGYGGAFGTRLGGGGVPDLMHYDLGGSRGNMRPQVQFARLQPLNAQERSRTPVTQVAATTQAPQAAQPQAPQVAMRQPKPTEVYKNPELPATSAGWFGGKNEPFRPFDVTGQFGVPKSDPLTTNTDAMQLAAFGDPKQAPSLPRLTPQQGGAALAARPGGLAARSALDYVAGGEPQVPQASGVPARSEIDYNAPPAPQQREAPTVAPYEAAPEEPPQPQQREAPEVGPYEAPPEYENRDAVPQSPTPFDWPQEGMPQSPDIAGPPINLQGAPPSFPTAQGDYPPPAFPQVAETSHNYDPNTMAGRRIDAIRNQPPAGPSYFDQLIRQATSGANITPTLPLPPSGVQGEATATVTPEDVVVPPTPPTPTAKPTPTTIRDITKAIYGSEIVRPRVGGGRGAAEVEYARNANQPKPPTAEGTSEERQAQFNAAMQEYVKEKLGGAPVDMARGAMERIFKAAPDVMQQIIDKAKEYSGSPASSTRVKSSAYGRDWMPTKPTPQAPGAKPPKPGDDLPPPVGTLPDIQRPGGSRQQPTVMPNVTQGKMPPTPGSGGAAPQASTAEARRQAAAAKVNSGDNYSYTDDAGVVQFEIKE